MDNTKFIQLNKEGDVDFLKSAWNMEIPELQELLKFLEDKLERDKSLVKVVKGQTKALYKNGVLFYKSRIKFVKDVIHDKKMNYPIPDFAIKKQNSEMILTRRLTKLTESYAAIVNISSYDIKEYAKAAIRDIFIQMPTRSVNHTNWPGYKQYITGFFGENSYTLAMEELQKDGWLTKGETRYEWKKMYGPVGTVPTRIQNLNEWADIINYKGKLEFLYYSDKTAHAFGYVKGNMKIGKAGETHGYSQIPAGASDTEYPGRLWKKDKIISFWVYPESVSKLKEVIDDINMAIGEKVINNTWRVDVPNMFLNIDSNNVIGHLRDIKDWTELESDLIPIRDWNPDMIYNNKKFKDALKKRQDYHIMSPLEKAKKGIKAKAPGFGADKRYKMDKDVTKKVGKGYSSDDIPPYLKHQLKYTSENKLNEWADGIEKIKIPGKDRLKRVNIDFESKDAYPFAFYNGKKLTMSSDGGVTHSDIGANRDSHKYAGRVWTRKKIISFWQFPETMSKFNKLITELNKELKKLRKAPIDSSWKVDVPYMPEYNLKTYSPSVASRALGSGEFYDIPSLLIPLNEFDLNMIYRGKDYFNNLQRAIDIRKQKHALSPIAKKDNVPSGIGSKKNVSGLTATQVHQMKSTSENKLNEWADTIVYPDSGKVLEHMEPGAYPFIYSLDEKFAHFGKEITTHDMIPIKGHHKKDGFIMGRIWTEEKIISLWEYPDTSQEYRELIRAVNDGLKKLQIDDKINNSWKFDLPAVATDLSNAPGWKNIVSKAMASAGENDFRKIPSFFIPALEWDPKMMKNPLSYRSEYSLQRQLHVMSPIAKAGMMSKIKGFGSDKRYANGDPQYLKHQSKYTSENISNKEIYDPNLNDTVEIDGKWFMDNKTRQGKIIDISPNKERLKVKCDKYATFNISTKNVIPIKNLVKESRDKYGCLMLKIDFPNWTKFVESYVKPEDIYDDAAKQYGYEYEPHVTVLYGFHNDVDIEMVKRIAELVKNPVKISTNEIDTFSTPQFDVVKFKIVSPVLSKLNEVMKKHFKYTTSHEDYNSHMTIAYVKKGLGQKYMNKLSKTITLSSDIFTYSYPDGSKEEFSIKKIE